MTEVFTPEQITALSAEIDAQLRELGTAHSFAEVRGGEQPKDLPNKQRRAIEDTTQQDAPSFMKRFLQAARKDLCEEGGVLYQQWKKWGDLSNEKVLQSFGAILVAMGLTGNALQTLAVASAVIVLHLGAKTICEEAADSDSSSKETDSSMQ